MSKMLQFPRKGVIQASVEGAFRPEEPDWRLKARAKWQEQVRQMIEFFAQSGAMCYANHRPDFSVRIGLTSAREPYAYMN